MDNYCHVSLSIHRWLCGTLIPKKWQQIWLMLLLLKMPEGPRINRLFGLSKDLGQ